MICSKKIIHYLASKRNSEFCNTENWINQNQLSMYYKKTDCILFSTTSKNESAELKITTKAAFTEFPYLRICAKKYEYAYKKYAYAYKILTLFGLFYLAFYRTCIYTHAYFGMRFFLHLTKNKIRTRYAYFSSIYKEIFLRCDVTRLLSVVVMILAFETFNLDSVLTKI